MAIQTGSLRAAEHDWYAVRSGASIASLQDHKIRYYSSISTATTFYLAGNASIRKTLPQMERDFLRSIPTVVPPENIGEGDLWGRVLGNFGITATSVLTENKRLFYSTVTIVAPVR